MKQNKQKIKDITLKEIEKRILNINSESTLYRLRGVCKRRLKQLRINNPKPDYQNPLTYIDQEKKKAIISELVV